MKTKTSEKPQVRIIILFATFCALLANPAGAVSIYFDDGTLYQPIGSYYAAQGLTFQNASWQEPALNQSGTPSEGLCLADVTDNGFNPPYSPTSATPIVGIFSTPQTTVSILAVDVGVAGATLDIYDAISGGALLGSDTFVGVGSGFGAYHTLTVLAPNILRIELYQPFPSNNDGVFFDNLTFTAVPEPSNLGLLGLFGSLSLCAMQKHGYFLRVRMVAA